MTTLGKYELIEQLGSGATSEVYRARDTVLKRDVAIKLLWPALMVDGTAFTRFVNEAKAASELFHPNIATVLDWGEAEGRFFLVMRYIPGIPLNRLIQQKTRLEWNQIVKLAEQIGEALDFAHAQGFIHRDIKPSNIICTPNGKYVLTDFGLTRAMMSTGVTTHTGAILGTPPYIAPEIWDGETAQSSSDQYALACVIFEAAAGRLLFDGNTPPAVMRQHFKPVRLPEDWPEEIREALARALNQDAQQRFTNCAELTAALRGYKTIPDELMPPVEALAVTRIEETPITSPLAEKIEHTPRVKDSKNPPPLAREENHADGLVNEVNQCRNCGESIPAGQKFCPSCGQKFKVGKVEENPSLLGGIKATAIFSIITGIGTVWFFGLGLPGIIGGVGILTRKKWGRTWGIIHLSLMSFGAIVIACLSMARVIGDRYISVIPLLVFHIITLRLIFYFYQPPVRDILSPEQAPHPSNVHKSIDTFSWIYVFLIITMPMGIVTMNKRTRPVWIANFIITCIIDLAAFILLFDGVEKWSYRYNNGQPEMAIGSFFFILFSQIFLFLLRGDVLAAFPKPPARKTSGAVPSGRKNR